jgi:hypothetical protein
MAAAAGGRPPEPHDAAGGPSRPGLSRRVFLGRAGALGVAAALAGLPRALDEHGLLESAYAAEPDLVRDTFNGLVAFIVPGNDEYSVAQGHSTPTPGGIAAGATGALISGLDSYVPAPLTAGASGITIQASGGVANLLNSFALQVNPAPARGGFASPFARLSFAEKGEVFRRLESDPAFADTPFRFVAGILPGFTSFLSFSEAGVFDARGKRATATPVGWLLSGYGGPREGHRELRGYYRRRRSVRGGHRSLRRTHPHRRRRRRRGTRGRARRRRRNRRR